MKVYIVDVYDKYRQEGNEKSIYWIGGRTWCIREVEMEWGLPVVQDHIEYDVDPSIFHIYEDYNDAVEYIKHM